MLPPVILIPLNVALAFDKTLKTRSIPLALTIVALAPAPLMVKSPVMSRSPVALAFSPVPGMDSVYVPGGTVIVSAPVHALASIMAARREHCPPEFASEQIPSPGLKSAVSLVVFTANAYAKATRPGSRPKTTSPIATSAVKSRPLIADRWRPLLRYLRRLLIVSIHSLANLRLARHAIICSLGRQLG